jgi:hypothetical protein
MTKGISDYPTLLADLPTIQSGNDRVKLQHTTVVSSTGGAPDMVQTCSYVWTNGETDGTGTLISSNVVTTSGLTNWNSKCRNTGTPVTAQTFTIYTSSGHSSTSIGLDGSYSVSAFPYGRLCAKTNYNSTGTIQVSGSAYTYDAHGRQSQIADARNGATTHTFNNADLVASVITPNPGNGGYPETTTTYYDAMSQATNVIQPDGTAITNAYYQTGELKQASGLRTYPVAYVFDYAGRMQYMTNWQKFPASGAEVTTWNYDAFRG